MNPILISPQIASDEPIEEQLRKMKSYLFRFKEEVELLLSNIDTDNLSEKFEDDFSKVVGSKIMGSKEMSQIIQSAGAIKLQVEELGGSVASLTVATNGIYNQINDPDTGILTELSIVSGQVSAAVKFGVNYSGFKISSSKIHLFTTGALQIDSGNFQVDTDGNVTIVGNITANSGTFNGTINANDGTIGGFIIDEHGFNLNNVSGLGYDPDISSMFLGGFGDPDLQYLNIAADYRIQFNTGSAGDVYCNTDLIVDNNYTLKILGKLHCNLKAKAPSWEKFSTIGPDDYVLVGT